MIILAMLGGALYGVGMLIILYNPDTINWENNEVKDRIMLHMTFGSIIGALMYIGLR